MLGFDELLEAGLGQRQLEECIELMFTEGDEKKNNTPTTRLDLRFVVNLVNRIEPSDLAK